MRAKAATADGLGNFQIDEIDLGAPAANEALVEIKASGVCHTDWDSTRTWDRAFIMGHEGAGVLLGIEGA